MTVTLQEQKFKEALELVRAKRMTVWKAAEVAGVTYREMLAFLRTHNITFLLSEDELRREVDEVLGYQ